MIWLPTLVFLTYLTVTAEVSRECVHGSVRSDGSCACFSCWTGQSCLTYASRPPKFARGSDVTTLPADQQGGSFYRVVAIDPDQEFCQDPAGSCPCSKVTYFIANQDDPPIFSINTDTGDVSLSGENFNLYSEYQLTIGASDDGAVYDTMSLVVQTGQSSEGLSTNKYRMDISDGAESGGSFVEYSSSQRGESLSRHKRATVTLPSNVTFTLSKYGLTENETEIRVGIRIQFRLEIVFPGETTDIQVELFAPDSDNIIMALCEVKVTVGSNLKVSGTTTPILESMDNSKYNDRAIISLGNVTNTKADLNSFTPSTMVITYEAVMIKSNSTVEGQEYWVSAGAEYNNENEVWVGQASFTARTSDDSSTFTESPNAVFNGQNSISVGSCANYTIDLKLNKPYTGIQFDFFAPYNVSDVMSVCQAKVLAVNSAYGCTLGNYWDYTPAYISEGNSKGSKHVKIDMGKSINKYAREYEMSSRNSAYSGLITFGVQVCMKDDPLLVYNSYTLGSTFQIGTDTIQANLLQVTVAPKSTAQTPITPTFTMSFPSGDGISQSKPAIIQLDVGIPEFTSGDYLLEVLAPMKNGLPVFQVCSVKLVSWGENFPCLDQRTFDVRYIFNSNISTNIYPDAIKVNLGTISNLGTFGWTKPNTSNSQSNLITFNLIFKSTDHPNAVVGSVHEINVGLFLADTKLAVGKMNVTIIAETAATALNDTLMPQTNFSLAGNTSGVYPIGQTIQVLLDVKSARNVIYSPFNIEFIMPNSSGAAMIRICKVKLQFVGANNPCVVAEGMERAVQKVSSFEDGVMDRAVLNMPALCNIEQKNDPAEDHIMMMAYVALQNHPQFSFDNTTWINAGIMYSKAVVSILRLSVQAVTGNPPGYLPSAVPFFEILNKSQVVPRGYPARFLVRFKIPPGGSTPVTMEISTNQSLALSLCMVRVLRVGEGFPCLEPVVGNITVFDQQLGINTGGTLDLGFVSNVASGPYIQNSSWDNNTIELEVVTRLSLDPSLAPDGSSHSLNLVVRFKQSQTGHSKSDSATVTATSDSSLINSSTLSSPKSGTMIIASITGQDSPIANESIITIVKSESKRVVMTIETPLNATSNLSVSFTTPTNLVDAMEVLYIGLLDAGPNVPCAVPGLTQAVYEPRQAGGLYTDIATLHLGCVCNEAIVTNDTMGTANKLRVEGVIRLLSSAKVSLGTLLQVHGAIVSNNQELFVYNLNLTVGDEATYKYVADEQSLNQSISVSHNLTQNPITAAISEIKVFPLIFTVAPFTSSRIILDAVMPVNTSAIFTIIDFNVVSSGPNLPQINKSQIDFIITRTSQLNTSQITKYFIDMGVVSNSGVTYRYGQNKTDHDSFRVDFTLQMADSLASQDLTIHKVSFGLSVCSVVSILQIDVTASRTGQEMVDFNVSSWVDYINSTANRVEVDTTLKLSNHSSAEGQDTVLNIYLPEYVSYVSTVVTSPYKTISNIDKNNNAVSLSIGPLFFTDEVNLTTVITSDAANPVPVGVTGLESIFVLQPVANTHTTFDVPGNIQYVNFSIATTPMGSSGCSLGALGLQDGSIKDCQISSSPDSISEAKNGRYQVGPGWWTPFVHTGKVREERYFQVLFRNLVIVSKIKLQQGGPAWVVKINLQYSNDGLAWIKSDSQISLTTGLADQELDVPLPQVSRAIRVMITALDDETKKAALRFEFLGCETSSDGPTDPCLSSMFAEPPKLSAFSRRSFIKAGPTLYVCGDIQDTDGISQKCYASDDDRTWRAVKAPVGSMLGYDWAQPRLYGVSAHGMSYVCSIDGLDWAALSPEDMIKAQALPTYKSAIQVPVDGDPRLNGATPDAAFTDSNYGATVNGVMVNQSGWSRIFTWGQCCP